jgi:hypothetical protein
VTDLSPATQAVLDAYRSSHLSINNLAAALRAVADQLINVKWSCEMWELHRDIHAIAAELEGTND